MGSSSSKTHHNKNNINNDTINTENQTQNTFHNNIKMPRITNGESILLNEDKIAMISKYLPDNSYRETWKQIFNSAEDGHSYNRFQTHCCEKGSVLIIIEEEGKEGHVFGGFCDETIKIKYPKFYGNKNNFIFRLEPKIEIYQTTGLDKNYQYLNANSMTLFNGFAMGGELLYGFSIDSTFGNGESKGNEEISEILNELDGVPRASTYGNTCIASKSDYKIKYVEAYLLKELTLSEDDLLNIEYNNRKKGGTQPKSILRDEDNADKAIKGMMGNHEFTHYHEDLLENPEKSKNTTPLHP